MGSITPLRNKIIVAVFLTAAIVRFPADDLRLEMVALFQMAAVAGLCIWISTVNVWISGFVAMCFVAMYFPFFDMKSAVSFERVFFASVWFAVVVSMFDRKSADWLISAMCIVVMINVAYMLIQLCDADPLFRPKNPGSNCVVGLMGNQNLTSAVFAFGLPGFFRRKWRKLIPVVLLGMVLSKSTGGLAAGICGGLFYSACTFNHTENAYILVGCLMSFVVYILVVDPPVFLRFTAWREAMGYFWQHWAMGSGLGHWKTVFLKYRLCGGTWWVTAHNEMIQAVFEMGIGVSVLFLGYFRNLYIRFDQRAVLPYSAVIIIIVNSLVNFPFHIGTTALIAVTWLAILEIYLRPNEVFKWKQA